MPTADLLAAGPRRQRQWPRRLARAGAWLGLVFLAATFVCRRTGLEAGAVVARAWHAWGDVADGIVGSRAGVAEPVAVVVPVVRSAPMAEQGASGAHEEPTLEPNAEMPSMAVETHPLSEWLARIASRSGLGLVVDPKLDGPVTARLGAQTPWRRALEAFARTYGFDYAIGDGLIEVVASKPQAAVPPAPVVPANLGEMPAAKPTTAAFTLERARADEVVEALAGAKAAGVAVAADPVANAVLVSGPQQAVAVAGKLVRSMDVARRSVLLEARIVELSRTAREELGVQWSLEGKLGASVDLPAADSAREGAALLVATQGTHALRARLGALEADGKARVVSEPRVVILEGRSATIESVRVLRIRLPDRAALLSDDDGLDVVTPSGRAVEEIPVGVILEVTPTLARRERVELKIRAESSTLGPPQPPDGIPEEFSRRVEAEVAVASGQTVVLGGMVREGTTSGRAGVPGLRDVPVLGVLFGRRLGEAESEELVFLVTPTLLDP